MQSFDPDNDPWRRGIYRTNAQRLSISLKPPVAQQALLFRIKTDLVSIGKESYSELEDLEESPMLNSITPASAQIESIDATNMSGLSVTIPHHSLPTKTPLSIGSALSPTSVYSQDSWKPNSSLVPPAVDIEPKTARDDF